MSADVAAELRALASRVRRNVPDRHKPERFHEEVSEIAHALHDIAAKMGVTPGVAKPKPSRRQVVISTLVNGRRITVQKPRPSFAIFIGGK
jgi:hypothetical protein